MALRFDIDFFNFFEDSPCPMWILDSTTLGFLNVNEAATKQYGYNKEEFFRMYLPDVRVYGNIHNQNNLQELIESRDPKDFFDGGTSLHKNKKGETFYVHVYAQSIELHGRKVGLALLINDDARVANEIENQQLNTVIKQQKDQLEDILSTVNDVVWSRRASDLKLLYINKASVDVYGYTPDELIGEEESLFVRVHPKDKEKLENEIERTLTTGKGHIEYRIFHRDGSIRYLNAHGVVKRDANGKPELIDGVTIDITQLRQTQKDLAKKTHEVEAILESIKDGFFTLDRNWNFVYVNKEFEKIYHCTREDMLGVNYWEMFPQAKQKKYYAEYTRAVDENINVYFEEFSSSLNKWVSINAYPTKDGLTVYFKDISEERKLKEKILADEQNLSALIDNTRDIIWSIDKEFRLISCNNSFRETAYELTGIIPQPGETVLHENFGKAALDHWRKKYIRAFEGVPFRTLDENVINNKTLYKETYFNPIKNKEGEVVGVGCFSRDITEEKMYLQKIQSQNERLQQIAWIQSHKVRGPVASILGLMELLNMQTLDEANKEIVNKLKQATQNMDNIIREINSTAKEVE